jgi:hypothetical protein
MTATHETGLAGNADGTSCSSACGSAPSAGAHVGARMGCVGSTTESGNAHALSRGLSAIRVRDVLTYDAESGALTWRQTLGARAKAGRPAGNVSVHGYVTIGIDGVRAIPAHRVAWVISFGEWPALEVDHIDGDRSNNRLANLRLVTTAQNHQNMRSPRCDNRAGLLGVSPYGDRFRAQIQAAGRKHWIGEFATAEEAHEAYVERKRQLHEFGTL